MVHETAIFARLLANAIDVNTVTTKSTPVDIQSLIEFARQKTVHHINQDRTRLYWQIGKVVSERKAAARRLFGDDSREIAEIIAEMDCTGLAGFGAQQLEKFCRFYQVFPFANAVCEQLSWSHYKLLIQLEPREKREFYLEQATRHNWPAAYLQKQIELKSWERLQRSNSRLETLRSFNTSMSQADPVAQLADIDNLSYLGLDNLATKENTQPICQDSLIDFFLQCGKGFCLSDRQTIETDGMVPAVQLTFYNRVLNSTVLVRILQERGEDDWHPLHNTMLQYDSQHKRSDEGQTIGILVTNSQEQPNVSYLIPGDNNNIIREIKLFLPNEAEILAQL